MVVFRAAAEAGCIWTPGLAFRSNWQSTDRIELIYTRRFYSNAVDNNPARPLDRNVLALGAYINF